MAQGLVPQGASDSGPLRQGRSIILRIAGDVRPNAPVSQLQVAGWRLGTVLFACN